MAMMPTLRLSAIASNPPTTTCGLRKQPPPAALTDGYFIPGQTRAFMLDATSSDLSIYMDNRGLLGTQTLTVSGTNMTDYYVQGSVGGTANIFWRTAPRADLIEAGGGADNRKYHR